MIGRNIAIIRRGKGITQKRLSELTCVSKNYINAIERGIKKPSIKLMAEIASVLDVSLEELFKTNN